MKPLSMSDVSDLLFEFYKGNHTEGPKNVKTDGNPAEKPSVLVQNPAEIDDKILLKDSVQKKEAIEPNVELVKMQRPNPNGFNEAVAPVSKALISKNVHGDEMGSRDASVIPSNSTKRPSASFHPRIKFSTVNNKPPVISSSSTTAPAGSTVPHTSVIPAPVIQAPILPPPPAAAAIAAAFFRDGYHNLQQQIRAQELLKQHPNPVPPIPSLPAKPQFYMQNFMRKSKFESSENGQSSSEENDDEYDEEGGNRYPEIDDIHLIEGSKSGFSNQLSVSLDTDYSSEDCKKYSIMAQAFRNLEYSFGEYGNGSNTGEEPLYQCRHCGKRYRWKSTLRRHENVECGGKEPSHQCPYCAYKSKQRGNLGVHVRKHHANLPQLASKRRSKYSQPRDQLIEPHRN